jgi:predicted ArsR family transcriptional regulator
MVNLPNLWVTVDLPVLAQSAYALEVKHDGQVDTEAVATELGLSAEDAMRSLVRLWEDGLLDGADASTFGGDRQVIVTRMTARGRREVGMWPSSRDGEALVEAIEQAIAQTDDEETKGWLRQMAKSARNVSEGMLASIAAAAVSRMTLGQ